MITPPVTALVQARMGSQRFPGKMAADLCGSPMIEWVLSRVKSAKRVDRVVLCTSDHLRDDRLAEMAVDIGVAVFRGSEANVLDRFARAAEAHAAGTVVRICADNPLISGRAIDLLVDRLASGDIDYAYNNVPADGADWPDGFGAEVLPARLLAELDEKVGDPAHREHVTSWIRHGTDAYRIGTVPCPEAWRDPERIIRLDVDYKEDLESLRILCDGLAMDADPETILAKWRVLNAAPGRVNEAEC